MWKPPSYDHRFDTKHTFGVRFYVWVQCDAPAWCRSLYDKISEAYWFLQHRLNPRHRYHIINTGLGYGFRDTDTIIEAVLVKKFIEFIESEDPFNHFVTDEGPHVEMWKEMWELYQFFKQNDWRRLDDAILTEKLHSIIDLRNHMWT
jgi:hypothetical protein